MIRIGVAVAVACLGAVLAGCGGGDDSTNEPASADTVRSAPPVQGPAIPVPNQAALEAAVRAYSAAYLQGDPTTAYSLLSVRCQQALGQQQFGEAVAQAASEIGPHPIVSLHVDKLQGTQAQVSYTYTDASLNQSSERWVAEGGKWHEDDCG